MDKIGVILCDDHPLVLEGLHELIRKEQDIEVTAAFSNATDLMQFIHDKSTGVLILDLHLQDGDGMALCKTISKKCPGIRVLGLSGVEDPAVISHFIKNGAHGYLLKSAGGEEILTAIRKVSSDEEYLSDEIRMQVFRQISDATKRSSSGYIPNLSMREKEVLKLITDEFTTQEIADKLFISVNTVETHRNHLLQKLGAKNVAGLVRIAIEKGLV